MTQQPANPKRLLRLKEAAAYLSLSPGKLRALVQKAELPVIVYDKNAPWLLDVRDLDAWVDRHKQASLIPEMVRAKREGRTSAHFPVDTLAHRV